MNELNLALFHAINLPAAAPAWALALARFASLQLPPMLLVLAAASLVLKPEWRRLGWGLLLAMALAWLGARLLQQGWPMPRPFVLGVGHLWIAHGGSSSFPSTHASVACAWGALAWLRAPHPAVRWGAPALAGLVAWSRVAVGVHFPLDVAAGLALGMAAAWTVHRLRPRALWPAAASAT
jgi:undecaprenyl-diphosphatase